MGNGVIRSVIAAGVILTGAAFLGKATNNAYKRMGASEATLVANGFPQKRIDRIENSRHLNVFQTADSLESLVDSTKIANEKKLADSLQAMGNAAKAGLKVKK